MTRLTAACVSGCLTLATGSALSADLQYAVGIGAGHTDNVRRAASAERSDTIGAASLQLSLLREGRLNADIATDLEYQTYSRDTYDSELIGTLRGTLAYALVPDRLQWVVADNFGQTRTDIFTAATPENRENINFFSTGPDVRLRLGPELLLRLEGRFGRVDYQTSPFDSDRWSAAVSLEHPLNSGAALSLGGATERVDYSNQLAGPSFDRRQLFAGYQVAGSRTTLQIRAGINQIDRAGETTDGAMVRLDLTRRIAGRSLFSLGIGRELTDAGSLFGASGTSTVVSTDTQSLARGSNPYTNQFARAGWDVAGRVTRLGGSVAFYRESYLSVSTQDRDRLVAEVHASRDLGPRLAVRVNASSANDDFREAAADAHEMVAGIGLSWRAGRRLNIDARYEHSYRHADISTSEFRENRIWVNLRWGDAVIRNVGTFGSL